MVVIRADYKAANVVETHEEDNDNMKSGKGTDNPELESYFVSAAITGERVLAPLLVHAALPFCL